MTEATQTTQQTTEQPKTFTFHFDRRRLDVRETKPVELDVAYKRKGVRFKTGLAVAQCAYVNNEDPVRSAIVNAVLSEMHCRDQDLRMMRFYDCIGNYADFRGSDLRHTRFREGIWYNADFRNANLERVAFIDLQLGNVDFRGANMNHVNFNDGARFAGAKGIVEGGTRRDGYRFWGWVCKEEGLKIRAGCRNFTLEQAHSWWGRDHRGSKLAAESMLIVESIQKRAELLGLLKKPETSK
jgi:hypothetical protein